MLKKHTRRWARYGLISSLVFGFLPASVHADDEELEPVFVTGSRISRIDLEGPSPVLRLDRSALDATGFSTVGDALRSLPITSGQALVPVDAGTSFTPGIGTLNLRGLGNNNLLVLVNGRRSAPFGASGFNGFQTMFDLNSLPTSAIENIEILKDGASAIYGSDAVSGVVNVILRRDFEGMTTTFGVGNTFNTDSFEKQASVVMGTTSGNTSIVVTADWYERNAIFSRDLKHTSNTDLRDIGGANRSSNAGWPGMVWVNSIGGWRTFPAPMANPTAADAVPFGTDLGGGRTAGFYNYLQDSDLLPEIRQFGMYTAAKHTISDDLYAFAEVSFRRVEPTSQSAPTPMFSWNEQGYYREMMSADQIEAEFGVGTQPDPRNRNHYHEGMIESGIMIPAYNPFNPWGEDLDDGALIRFTEVGNRLNEVTSDTARILAGIGGNVMGDWSYELAALYNMSSYTNRNGGALQDRLVQDAFHGLVFDEGSPEEVTLYLNPFGPSDQRVYDYMTINNPITSDYQVYSFDGNISGPLFDLEGGTVQLAAGFEYREEELDDRRTALNETGQIVGGSEGSSVFGSRNVKAIYAEVSVPVIQQLELQFAARYEDYSDFGDTTKPKIAAVFKPTGDILLRASYSQSFLAPNLPFLYTAQSTSFTSAALEDPRRPADPLRQIKMLGGGNPDLQPEETDTYYVGVAYNPQSGPLEGLYLGLDFFVFQSKNLIDRFGAQEILDNEMTDPAFAALVVRNPPQAGETVGVINYVRTTWENLETRHYRGFDFDVRYRLRTGDLGDFTASIYATYLRRFEFASSRFEGSRFYPEWRGNFNLRWDYADWSANVFVNYIHSRSGSDSVNAAGQRLTNARYASHLTVNPQVTYSGLWNTRITLGVRNALNKVPGVDYGEATRYTPGVGISPEPSFWYLRVARDF